MCGADGPPAAAVRLVEVRLRTARAGQQVVPELSQLGARDLVRGVRLVGPGVPAASLAQLKPNPSLPHHKDVAEGIAVGVVEVLHGHRVHQVEHLPRVGLGPLQAEAGSL